MQGRRGKVVGRRGVKDPMEFRTVQSQLIFLILFLILILIPAATDEVAD